MSERATSEPDLATSGRHTDDATGPSTSQLVWAALWLAVAAATGLRAWALYPSWFFTDDYRLMLDAQGEPLTWSYLVRPFDSQFMPWGRLEVWLVTHAGLTAWPLTASITLVTAALAALACVFMLTTLFGPRPAVVGLLVVYLSSAVVLPGTMWWAAALNQLPLQAVFFAAVGCWVRHLRSGSRRWLALTFLVLLVGLTAYVKTLLVLPVLAVLALGWFATGGLRARLVDLVRHRWPALVLAVPFVGFVVWYRLEVRQPFTTAATDAGHLFWGTADGMLATSLPTGVLGGPWRWFDTSPPIVLADPPSWTVHLAWVVIAGLVAVVALRRERTAWAWGLVAGYALVAFVLLATSRGQLFGRVAGQEYRYLTDVLPVVVLGLGLALLELPGAPGSSRPRATPRLVWSPPRWLAPALVAVVVLGGVVSSVQYVGFWHDDNASRGYVQNLQSDLDRLGPTDLADQLVPPAVMPDYTQPRNRTEVFVPLVADGARFPDVSDDLHAVTDDGSVEPARVSGGVVSEPGPVAGCGWRVGPGSVDVPLEQPTFDFTWWVEVGYLASAEDTVTVEVAGSRFEAPVHRGLGTVFVRVTGAVERVRLGGLSSGTMCVDTVRVGDVAPQGAA